MVTVNNRVKRPQASVINGVDAGGTMSAMLQEGFENVMTSAPDGLEAPIVDREIQYVRGTIVTQDWIHAVDLLTETVGTYVFYERKSGAAAATGYIKHTITNPVIGSVRLSITKGGYAVVSLDFECKAADETAGIAEMHAMTDSQAAPTYVSAARGGWRVQTTVFDTAGDAIDIYHVTGFEFFLRLPLSRACNDADVGYTCVDAEPEAGLAAGGSLNFQDAAIASNQLLAQRLVVHDRDPMVLTVTQSAGATAKTITMLGVLFTGGRHNSDVNSPFSGFNLDFVIGNDTSTPLTLSGANKIIAIADAS